MSFEQVAPRLASEVLRRFGEARLRVAGTSMLPAIRPADILLVRAVDITSVVLDDVILFEMGQRLFAHRVVDAGLDSDPRVLVTRGDMHAHDDPPVTEAHVLGRVEGQLRNGVAVPRDRAPRYRRGSRVSGVWIECLCALSIRLSVSRVANGLRLLRRAAKPLRYASHDPMDVRNGQGRSGPARIAGPHVRDVGKQVATEQPETCAPTHKRREIAAQQIDLAQSPT